MKLVYISILVFLILAIVGLYTINEKSSIFSSQSNKLTASSSASACLSGNCNNLVSFLSKKKYLHIIIEENFNESDWKFDLKSLEKIDGSSSFSQSIPSIEEQIGLEILNSSRNVIGVYPIYTIKDSFVSDAGIYLNLLKGKGEHEFFIPYNSNMSFMQIRANGVIVVNEIEIQGNFVSTCGSLGDIVEGGLAGELCCKSLTPVIYNQTFVKCEICKNVDGSYMRAGSEVPYESCLVCDGFGGTTIKSNSECLSFVNDLL